MRRLPLHTLDLAGVWSGPLVLCLVASAGALPRMCCRADGVVCHACAVLRVLPVWTRQRGIAADAPAPNRYRRCTPVQDVETDWGEGSGVGAGYRRSARGWMCHVLEVMLAGATNPDQRTRHSGRPPLSHHF